MSDKPEPTLDELQAAIDKAIEDVLDEMGILKESLGIVDKAVRNLSAEGK